MRRAIQIGRIFDALERSGKAKNTYVIMTADHGLAVGEHGLMGKQNSYECSMRIPMIVAGPDVPAGRRVDELVYQHSMFATTCELAGLQVPRHVEFASLVPLLKGGTEPLNEAVFGYYKNYQRSIRTKTHKLIVYPEVKRVQFFDLVNDPYEVHDLSQNSSMAEHKMKLYQLLKRYQKQLDDNLDLDESMHGVI